eukprot:9554581-Alexandrium_andersonii.AAC.1
MAPRVAASHWRSCPWPGGQRRNHDPRSGALSPPTQEALRRSLVGAPGRFPPESRPRSRSTSGARSGNMSARARAPSVHAGRTGAPR